ncbi:MAG: hypothetical protein ACRELA_03580 [Candidatus Rokuibacteriota bacterium]
MTLADYIPVPEEVPQFAAGLVMLVMAAGLMAYRPRPRLNRAFSLFLVLAGMDNVLSALDDTPAVSLQVTLLIPYFRMGWVFALVFLAVRYAQNEGLARVARGALVALLGLALTVEVAYLVRHDLFFAETGLGPLGTLWGLAALAGAGAGVLFAYASRRTRDPLRRQAGRTAAVAFGLGPAAIGVSLAVVAIRFGPAAVFGPGWGVVLTAAFILASIPALFTAFLLARRGPSWQLRGAPAAILVAAVTGMGATSLSLALPGRFPWLTNAFQGVWQLALPLLLGYAILRHDLFGLDLKIKWTLKQSTVAAIFLAVFFAVSEGAQALFSERMGTFVGIGAAAALVFAIHPLQHFAQRVADKAMPGVKSAGEMTPNERAELYRRQASIAWADGSLDESERAMLAGLRDQLGLTREEAGRLEDEVVEARRADASARAS